ncbi:MAG: hypothetical protein NZ529_07505 [Cytophagaceae bacterium]|nr:hypothetical protein [Cytophagaceae bacterium]MDW8456630.1 hypothetical protein [Cytophagaceae bacterium]
MSYKHTHAHDAPVLCLRKIWVHKAIPIIADEMIFCYINALQRHSKELSEILTTTPLLHKNRFIDKKSKNHFIKS